MCTTDNETDPLTNDEDPPNQKYQHYKARVRAFALLAAIGTPTTIANSQHQRHVIQGRIKGPMHTVYNTLDASKTANNHATHL